MTKFLLLVLLIVAVLWGPLSRLRGGTRKAPARSPAATGQPGGASTPPPDEQSQDIVPCAHCGLHLPRGDALPGGLQSGGQFFCSEEHRRRGARPTAG